ncbi:MAG: hypothetical protein Q4A97_03550, partial [Comamonadaceae bacterium]|nr:hypothetical protein [Comamonadaceae bacterium]
MPPPDTTFAPSPKALPAQAPRPEPKPPLQATPVHKAPAATKEELELDYHALNAMLNLFGPRGEIQLDKDRLAARQYFLQHVNQNTVFF